MAGIFVLHVFGGQGGFGGSDGINRIELIVLQGGGNRMWFEPTALGPRVRALGKLRTTIPAGPSDPNALLDACLAFHADAFADCPALGAVEAEIGDATRLDFHLDAESVPASWGELREQARPIFETMRRWVAYPESTRGPDARPAPETRRDRP